MLRAPSMVPGGGFFNPQLFNNPQLASFALKQALNQQVMQQSADGAEDLSCAALRAPKRAACNTGNSDDGDGAHSSSRSDEFLESAAPLTYEEQYKQVRPVC